MDRSINGHEKLANSISEWGWYGGSDALLQGEAVCYNHDYGTVADADARRGNRMERPNSSNNRFFAGVAARNYSARTGGQYIEIYIPGSRCVPVALAVDTVANTGLLTFCTAGRYDIGAEDGLGTDAGRFYTGLLKGRGSVIPRQTVTAILEASMTGAWSLASDGVTLTVVSTTGLSAGDTVVFLGGEDDGTDTIIPGKYTISSITDGTTLVLTGSAMDQTTPTGAQTCTGYAYTGNPTALCDLLDGSEESGGLEFLNPPNAGSGAMPYMTGGITYICGGITLDADVDVDFAQGTYVGERKGFILLGDLATNDFTVDMVTNGRKLDGSTALTEVLTIDDAGDGWFGEFGGATWLSLDILVGASEG